MSTATPTRETYAEMQKAYDFFNRELFQNELPPLLITYQRKARTCGYYSSKRWESSETTTDELAMNPEHFRDTIEEVLSTLVHEMCHHWQHHFGSPSRKGYHNTEWADKMEAVGLMPSSTGKPGGNRTGQRMSDYIIEAGPFEAATKKLLKSGFTLTWKDVIGFQTPVGNGKPKRNRSNRTKYTCPECGFNAWARPRAAIVCGDCMHAMTPGQ